MAEGSEQGATSELCCAPLPLVFFDMRVLAGAAVGDSAAPATSSLASLEESSPDISHESAHTLACDPNFAQATDASTVQPKTASGASVQARTLTTKQLLDGGPVTCVGTHLVRRPAQPSFGACSTMSPIPRHPCAKHQDIPDKSSQGAYVVWGCRDKAERVLPRSGVTPSDCATQR